MDFSYKQLELIYETFRKSDLPSYRQIAIIAWNRIYHGKFKDDNSKASGNRPPSSVFYDPLYDEFLEVEE